MSDWHELGIKQVLRSLNASDSGLSLEESKARYQKFGANELPHQPPAGWFIILLRQFNNPFMYILIFAAGVSIAFADWVDAGVIAAAIVVNTLVGFIQEYKASQALEHLRSMVKPMVRVRRADEEMVIPAGQIVPGDLLLLDAGDHVAADARIVFANTFETNEAALTGESLPILKQVEPVAAGTVLAERTCMVYAGTVVTAGRARAVVVATGLRSELGKIAKLVSETKEEQTPLQVQLGRLAKWLSVLFVAVSLLIFAIGVLSGRSMFEMFLTAVALAVAAVPEGLIVAVTAIFAIGMQRILRRHALIRRLIATETLGSVSVICTDKTGTITEAQMKVTELVTGEQVILESKSASKPNSKNAMLAHQIAMLCNNTAINRETEGLEKLEVLGSPTESALVRAALEAGFRKFRLEEEHERFYEIPFDSRRKYMATVNAWDEDHRAILLKGAPERVLEFCQTVQVGGDQVELTEGKRARLLLTAHEMTTRGLRVLAVAYRQTGLTTQEITETDLPGSTFVAFYGLRDPIRADAKETIARAKSAGVRTVIITGDHPDTAVAIALEAGVEADPEHTMTGPDLDQLTDEEFAARVDSINVYARVEPTHKVRIVDAWQKHGAVVSMTGDGVNDAPALKAADIGVALGTGTEVAKETADMVLLDNALTTIVAAIEQGRVIFDNIRKVTVFLLANGFSEMILVGGAVLVGLPLPLLPAQILWVNLITDGFPSIALTTEPGEPGVMDEPPRAKTESIMSREMKVLIFIIAMVADIALFGIFYFLYQTGLYSIEFIRTFVLTALAVSSLMYVFAIKSFRRSILKTPLFNNKWLWLGVIVGFLLQIAVVTVPVLQNIFETVSLSWIHWLILLGIGSIKLVAIEVAKWFFIVKQRKV
ncbi:MAG: HAD-IC family P-type ATPase [Candidatus Uhrbacteria bacterium]